MSWATRKRISITAHLVPPAKTLRGGTVRFNKVEKSRRVGVVREKVVLKSRVHGEAIVRDRPVIASVDPEGRIVTTRSLVRCRELDILVPDTGSGKQETITIGHNGVSVGCVEVSVVVKKVEWLVCIDHGVWLVQTAGSTGLGADLEGSSVCLRTKLEKAPLLIEVVAEILVLFVDHMVAVAVADGQAADEVGRSGRDQGDGDQGLENGLQSHD